MKRAVKIGGISIGSGNKIAVQSMLNAPVNNAFAVKSQIDSLLKEGCDIIRIAVENPEAATMCREYVKYSPVPMVADIQYDWRLAILCSEFFAKIRFNPGNIGSDQRVKEVVAACKLNGVPIRIGVNGGSLEKDLKDKYGITGKALSESALRHVSLLEKFGFEDIVISAKASSVKTTVDAYRELNKLCDYPLHIGLTESGRGLYGVTKSAVCLGSLLLEGIGDTIRVSLSAPPADEVIAAKEILKSLDLCGGCKIIACPTCSRCKYDLTAVLTKVENACASIKRDITVAVMGCAVNGIGEAEGADYGIAGGGDSAVIFKKGQKIKTVDFAVAADELLTLIKNDTND